MRKLLIATAISALFCVNAAFADIKVGVIDLQKVLTSAPQVTAARAQLKSQFDPRNKQIVDERKFLQTDIEKYSKDNAVMKDQERKDLQGKITDEQKKLRDNEADFQQKFMAAQDKSMQEVTKQIQDVVDKIAKDQKYDLILAKGATAYNNPSYDITDQIITALKAKK